MIEGREEGGRSREGAGKDERGRESSMPVGGCCKISGCRWERGRKMMGGGRGGEARGERGE